MESITLNIRYDMPTDMWDKLSQVYESLPGWRGYILDGCPVWASLTEPERSISASVEPSGLLIDGDMPEKEFDAWISTFMQEASKALGFQVKDAEQ